MGRAQDLRGVGDWGIIKQDPNKSHDNFSYMLVCASLLLYVSVSVSFGVLLILIA